MRALVALFLSLKIKELMSLLILHHQQFALLVMESHSHVARCLPPPLSYQFHHPFYYDK
jgi:hypothetical protein